MTVEQKRQAIRHLLDEEDPADALAVYYALYHPEAKSSLYLYPAQSERAAGFVALSRTGMDLLRPLVTLRLPGTDLEADAELIYSALPVGTGVLLSAPVAYEPQIRTFFEIEREERLRIYVLDPDRFQPVINILALAAPSPNNLPRFVILKPHDAPDGGGVVAAAGLNWQSPRYAEISVSTTPNYRRRGLGRSVVSALAQQVLQEGRLPLYTVAESNAASIQLAEQLGFIDSGGRELMIEAVVKARP
jgi:RimJ/RimL family protein N-acetyltransferase